MARASVYLNNVYYHLDVVHRVAIVSSRGVVVGHLQVAVKLLSGQLHCFHTLSYCNCSVNPLLTH